MSGVLGRAVKGSLAGVAGTGPMTPGVEGLRPQLPPPERYPPPPRPITLKQAAQGGVGAHPHQAERQLPQRERSPLPPRHITMNVAAKAGVEPHLDEPERQGLTLAAHFAYGAFLGGLYGLLAPALPLPGAVKGVGYGLAAWAANYQG